MALRLFDLKLYAGDAPVIRRTIAVPVLTDYKFADLLQSLSTLAPNVTFHNLTWLDSDGEQVRLCDDEDLESALRCSVTNNTGNANMAVLRIHAGGVDAQILPDNASQPIDQMNNIAEAVVKQEVLEEEEETPVFVDPSEDNADNGFSVEQTESEFSEHSPDADGSSPNLIRIAAVQSLAGVGDPVISGITGNGVVNQDHQSQSAAASSSGPGCSSAKNTHGKKKAADVRKTSRFPRLKAGVSTKKRVVRTSSSSDGSLVRSAAVVKVARKFAKRRWTTTPATHFGMRRRKRSRKSYTPRVRASPIKKAKKDSEPIQLFPLRTSLSSSSNESEARRPIGRIADATPTRKIPEMVDLSSEEEDDLLQDVPTDDASDGQRKPRPTVRNNSQRDRRSYFASPDGSFRGFEGGWSSMKAADAWKQKANELFAEYMNPALLATLLNDIRINRNPSTTAEGSPRDGDATEEPDGAEAAVVSSGEAVSAGAPSFSYTKFTATSTPLATRGEEMAAAKSRGGSGRSVDETATKLLRRAEEAARATKAVDGCNATSNGNARFAERDRGQLGLQQSNAPQLPTVATKAPRAEEREKTRLQGGFGSESGGNNLIEQLRRRLRNYNQ